MIKEKIIKISMTARNIGYYKNKNYNPILNEMLEVKIEDLNPQSKIKVTAICEKCKKEVVLSYQKYILNKSRYGYYSCKHCSTSKKKITFLNKFKPTEITSYADRTYTNGKLQKQLGFKFDSIVKPEYFYVFKNNRVNKLNFKKQYLINDGYNPNQTEHDIMLERKIYRIYNSGYLKFIYKN